jgi:hypothetical protein
MAAKIIQNRWENDEEVTDIDCPLLLIHGQDDTLIPYT